MPTLSASSTTTAKTAVHSPLAALPATPVQVQLEKKVSLAGGTGPGKISAVLAAEGTLAPGASAAVNLSDGSAKTLTGAGGSLTTLRYVEVSVASPAGSLAVGGGSHPLAFAPAAATATIEAGGPHFAAGSVAGWPVSAEHAAVALHNPGAVPVSWQLLAAGE